VDLHGIGTDGGKLTTTRGELVNGNDGRATSIRDDHQVGSRRYWLLRQDLRHIEQLNENIIPEIRTSQQCFCRRDRYLRQVVDAEDTSGAEGSVGDMVTASESARVRHSALGSGIGATDLTRSAILS